MPRFTTPQAEENVACNLIPMIDIMFLLLLFFMLGADMSQHEVGNVVLADADMVKEEHRHGGKTSNVNVCHLSERETDCPAYASGTVCREERHWQILNHGRDFTDRRALTDRLKVLADDCRQAPEPGRENALSDTRIMIRADAQAPYGMVQRVMEACAENGLYRTELAAAMPPESR